MHAALIMAHKNKEQLIRLIRKLVCDEIDVYVHLDKKWNLSKEEIKEIEEIRENVYVIKKRIHGVLDRWSLPQIGLNLISAAFQNCKKRNSNYDYFMLLSGQDYPIKSKEYILKFLKEQYPKPLVDHELAEPENWVWGKFQLTKWNNKIDEIQKRRKKGIIRSILVGICVLCYKTEKFFRGIPWDNLQKTDVKIYGGSQWWILPRETIEYVLFCKKKRRKIYRELKRAWTPDENFFQTLAMNSPQAEYVIENDPIFDTGKGDFKAMTYCNFITPKKSFRGHPHTILTEDFDRVMAKKALFARKFDINEDFDIFDMIDEATNE